MIFIVISFLTGKSPFPKGREEGVKPPVAAIHDLEDSR